MDAFNQHNCLPDASLRCLHFSRPPQAWERAIAALGCSGGGINRGCSRLPAPLWSSEGRGLLRGGTPLEEGYFLGRGYLRRGSPRGKEEGKLLQGGNGCFYEEQISSEKVSPRGEVSLEEGSLQGREFFRGGSLQKRGVPGPGSP